MYPDGRREVIEALQDGKIESFEVTPGPDKEGNYRYITIRTPDHVTPADVLNALADNMLMYTLPTKALLEQFPDSQPVGDLVPVATHLGSVTLEDVRRPF